MSAPYTSFRPRQTRLRRGRIKSRPYRARDSRAGVKQELDELTSLIVRKRDGQCVTRNEDCAGELTCSHFYKRSYVIIRFDFTNCNAQCARHNELHNVNPWPYLHYMHERYSEEAVSQLHKLRMDATLRLSDTQLKVLLAQYRTIWNLMRKGWSFEAACGAAGLKEAA